MGNAWMTMAVCAGIAALQTGARAGEEEDVHPGFELMSMRPPGFEPRVTGMDFLSGGRMAISTWQPNEVYILSGTDGPVSAMKARRAAVGFKEVMGLCAVRDTVFVADQDRLYALSDKDGDGLPETRTAIGAVPFTGSFHEWSFGLVFKDDRFHTALSVAAKQTGNTVIPQKDRRRGSVISMTRDGRMETVATGLRAPDGLGLGPDGELFATDNQGSWLPASKLIHVRQGKTYGHRIEPAGAFDDGFPAPPAAWLPYGTVTKSPTQPVFMAAGPYAGQMFYGDIAFGVVRRVFLEKVGGEYQGCVLRFSGGFEAGVHRMLAGPDGSLYLGGLGNGDIQNWGWHGKLGGLQRLKPNGKSVFEIVSVRARKGGFEVTYSSPPGPEATAATRYKGRQWWYEPTAAYGGPQKDAAAVPVKSARASSDGLRVYLEMEGLHPQQVVHVHLDGIRSAEGKALWTPDFWYTLNALGTGEFQP